MLAVHWHLLCDMHCSDEPDLAAFFVYIRDILCKLWLYFVLSRYLVIAMYLCYCYILPSLQIGAGVIFCISTPAQQWLEYDVYFQKGLTLLCICLLHMNGVRLPCVRVQFAVMGMQIVGNSAGSQSAIVVREPFPLVSRHQYHCLWHLCLNRECSRG